MVSSIRKRGSPSGACRLASGGSCRRATPARRACRCRARRPGRRPPTRRRRCSRRRRRRAVGRARAPARPAGRGSTRWPRAACAVARGRRERCSSGASGSSSSRARIAIGSKSLLRAAASSIASGRPSRRAQMAATADAFCASSAKSGRTARARWMKSATASNRVSDSGGGRALGSGTPSGGTGYSCSPRRWRTSRLDARTVRWGAVPRSRPTSGAPSDDLLEVVGDEQQVQIAQVRLKELDAPAASGLRGGRSPGRSSSGSGRRR